MLVYCLAQCLLYACLGSIFPEALNAAMIVIVGHLMLLASREGVSQLADQNRAKELFSQCWVATYAFVDGGLWLVNRHSQLITGLSTEGMVGIIVLAALQAAPQLHQRAQLRLGPLQEAAVAAERFLSQVAGGGAEGLMRR